MANISVTAECNKNCAYCFTHSAFSNRQQRNMSVELFTAALDFLDRSRIDQIRLLGGEPTLHPDFRKFLEMALKRNKEIRIFTNGIIEETTLDFLYEKRNENISYLINIPAFHEEKDTGQLERTLERLGAQALPGINLYSPEQELSFLFSVIAKYHLKKSVRLGIAHPCTGFDNSYLYPGHYIKMGEKISAFIVAAKKQNISIIPDCGFVPCMFTGDTLPLWLQKDHSIGKSCSPIIDILPDGSIIPCYPLASVCREKLDQVLTVQEAKAHLLEQLAVYDAVGIFKECRDCPLFQARECYGGCRAAAIKRMQMESFSFKIR